MEVRRWREKFSAPAGTRTHDPSVRSPSTPNLIPFDCDTKFHIHKVRLSLTNIKRNEEYVFNDDDFERYENQHEIQRFTANMNV